MIEKLGQLFIVGFDTAEPSDEFLDFLAEENIGGVILFEENCSPHSLAESSIRKIVAGAKTPPFIGVDQEGGRVCRFKGAPAEYGSPEEYGNSGDLELFIEHFTRSAYYLNSLGINLLFGPVADLYINRENSCLKGRSFGSVPSRVVPFIENAVKIADRAGLISCLKHFPGFGAADIDPHRQLARVDYDYQTFINREALTFKAGIGAGADMIMTTHMLAPNLVDLPATISPFILQRLLRDVLEFDGLAVTDDLLMAGAESFGDVDERALKAFLAGHDILLFGRDFRAARKALELFKRAYSDKTISAERLELSCDRIAGIKSKLTVPAV
jgi:beta-N-acetylhexosaminidase